MTTIEERLLVLQEEFALLDGLEERYGYLIDLGRELPSLPETDRTEENRVRGCASQVWLLLEDRGERLSFRGDSDAAIVRGLVGLVTRLLDEQPKAQIAQFDMQRALAALGLGGALSQQRSNGLASLMGKVQRACTGSL